MLSSPCCSPRSRGWRVALAQPQPDSPPSTPAGRRGAACGGPRRARLGALSAGAARCRRRKGAGAGCGRPGARVGAGRPQQRRADGGRVGHQSAAGRASLSAALPTAIGKTEATACRRTSRTAQFCSLGGAGAAPGRVPHAGAARRCTGGRRRRSARRAGRRARRGGASRRRRGGGTQGGGSAGATECRAQVLLRGGAVFMGCEPAALQGMDATAGAGRGGCKPDRQLHWRWRTHSVPPARTIPHGPLPGRSWRHRPRRPSSCSLRARSASPRTPRRARPRCSQPWTARPRGSGRPRRSSPPRARRWPRPRPRRSG